MRRTRAIGQQSVVEKRGARASARAEALRYAYNRSNSAPLPPFVTASCQRANLSDERPLAASRDLIPHRHNHFIHNSLGVVHEGRNAARRGGGGQRGTGCLVARVMAAICTYCRIPGQPVHARSREFTHVRGPFSILRHTLPPARAGVTTFGVASRKYRAEHR